MFGGSKTIVGLDVGSHTVKAVALTPNKDRVTLSGYAMARIGNQDPALAVRAAIEQLGIKPKHLISSVSGRSVIVRQVETPKLQGEELKAHITYEADKYIPFGTDEVIIDCQPLPPKPGATAADTTQQVLLVAVKRSFVEDHLNLLRSAGVAPEVIDVDVFAVSNAYELFGPGAKEDVPEATALIDIGASKSNIAIIHAGRLLFSREVYLAGNEITDAITRTFNEPAEEIEKIKAAPGEALDALIDAAMPAFEDLANEIRLSFDYVEGQFDKQVGAVILTGGSSLLPTIADILGNILSRPVHVFDPLAGLDLVPSKYDIHGLDASAPCLTVALGLAAHLLSGKASIGLGGQQSHGWQPRGDTGAARAGTVPAAPPVAAEEPESSSIPPPQDEPLPLPSTPAPSRTPIPPAAQLTQQPSAAYTPVPPPAAIAAPPVTQASSSTSMFNSEVGKSGLLVILDDEQESTGTERKTGEQRRPTIKLENFDDDAGGGLPQLPKL